MVGLSLHLAKGISLGLINMFGLCSGGAPSNVWEPFGRLVI